MALKYTTPKEFLEFFEDFEYNDQQQTNGSMSSQPNFVPQKETLQNDATSTDDYYFGQKGVVENTISLTSDGTPLVETTHYAVDYERGYITLTEAGKVIVGENDILATYGYSMLGFKNAYINSVLGRAEADFHDAISTTFANQTEDSPEYIFIEDARFTGKGYDDSVYETDHYPLVKLATTVAANFTLGDTELTLTDSTGLPATGTIYIDGNKVSYTAINYSSHVITVPNTTPTIASGTKVRGEVVELNTAPAGTDPNYRVLLADTEYVVDYDTGDVQILDRSYTNSSDGSQYGYSDRPQDGFLESSRITYYSAYHHPGKKCTIPDDVEEIVYMIASNMLSFRALKKAHISRNSNTNLSGIRYSEEQIEKKVGKYAITHVGRA